MNGPKEATAESSLVGQTFDNKFRVLRLIGRGGMGEVFEAEHVELGKRVAVKLMLEKYTGDSEAVARFRRESLAASRIGDPHIIHVMDIGTAPDGRAYVVMELLSGIPLSRLIEDHGRLPPTRALRIIRQVLRAVGAAHRKGIVHRDLKPDNIFLQRRDEDESEDQDYVKLLDFGISKFMDPEHTAAATKLTTTGVVMGTPLYMAPEQAMGADIDHHADIYAIGVMLYEMLAGKPPFEGNTYAVLVAKLLTTEAPLLSTVRDGLAPKIVSAVHRALEKEPAKRWHSCDELLAALPSSSSGSSVELAQTMPSSDQMAAVHLSTRRGAAAPARRTMLVMAGALVLGIGAGAAVIVAMTKQDLPATTPTTPTPEPAPPSLVVTPIDAGSAPVLDAAPGEALAPTRIMLAITPLTAAVTIDGTAYPASAGVTVEPGEHVIKAELAGYKTHEQKVTIAAKQTLDVAVALKPNRRPSGAVPGERDPRGTVKVAPSVPTSGSGARDVKANPYEQ